MARKLCLIVNPASGRGAGDKALKRLRPLYEGAGYAVSVTCTRGAGDARRAAAACDGDTARVVCVGGDGTLSETLDGLLRAAYRPPVCYVPLGSTNDFARSANLPRGLDAAARLALTGEESQVDAGLLGERAFTYVACFGAFSRTSYITGRKLKNKLGHLAYVLSGAKELTRIRPYRVRVESDAGAADGDFLFGAVCNTRSLGGMVRLPVPPGALSDGRHELLLVREPRDIRQALSLLWAIAHGRAEHPLITCLHVSRAVFYMPGDCPWSLDGEYMPGAPELTFQNLKGAWRVLRPGE